MKPEASKGKTNWDKLRAKRASVPKPSESELEKVREFWADADVVIPDGKTRMTVRFDTDVVEWFKSSGAKYQTRMNAVLRHFMTAQLDTASNQAHVGQALPDDAKGINEYMEALNQLGRIRLQQGDIAGASRFFEEAVNCYRSYSGASLDMVMRSSVLNEILAKEKHAARVGSCENSQLMEITESNVTQRGKSYFVDCGWIQGC